MARPGWHPDPAGHGERWHDGSRWTGVTRSDPRLLEAAARLARRRRRRAQLGRALVVLTLLGGVVGGAYVAIHGKAGAVLAAKAGAAPPHRLLPAPSLATGSLNYAILQTDAAGDPVTYDPCEPIHYAINRAGAPADYLSFIRPAVRAAQKASGLKFVYDGPTTATFDDRQHLTTSSSRPQPEPVVIGFPATLKGTDVEGDTIGLGGSTSTTLNGAVQPHYVTGAIALRSDWFAHMSAEHQTGAEQAVVMHELGHVLGLGHVQDPGQIMYPQYHGQAKYGAGDLAGLAAEGTGSC